MANKKENKLIGRSSECQLLNDVFQSKRSKIVAIYGRRRIGKSFLVKCFASDKYCFSFEGLESGKTKDQLKHFFNSLKKQTNDPLLVKPFSTWNEAFDFLTERLIKTSNKKVVIFLDELQWMASGRETLISLIKYYWDNFWINNKVMLILCGSISSFMINKVIRSKALYGRVSNEICLREMSPKESLEMLGDKFSQKEMLDVLLCFGAVPKYLEEIETKLSLPQNIIKQCFQVEGFFF